MNETDSQEGYCPKCHYHRGSVEHFAYCQFEGEVRKLESAWVTTDFDKKLRVWSLIEEQRVLHR